MCQNFWLIVFILHYLTYYGTKPEAVGLQYAFFSYQIHTLYTLAFKKNWDFALQPQSLQIVSLSQ